MLTVVHIIRVVATVESKRRGAVAVECRREVALMVSDKSRR